MRIASPVPRRWAAAVVAIACAARAAHASHICSVVIAAEAAHYTQSTLKAVAACARRHVADCRTDPVTNARVTRATARFRARTAAACCGADGTCGTADDVPLATIGWDTGYCPNLDRGDCNNLIADVGDVATCLACIGRAAADDLTALTAVPAQPAPVGRCASTLERQGTRFALVISKALATCWASRAAGGTGNPCPPGDGRPVTLIAAAASHLSEAVCHACGGADRLCGGGDDIMPGTLGFATACPSVSVPGGNACGGPIATISDVAGCIACVAAHDAECADHAAVPQYVTYPSACADPPGSCSPGVECASGADCPAGYSCLDNGSGTTRYCVGPGCTADADCSGGAVCRQYCTFAGCGGQRCVCPGFACGPSEVCIDDGGLACRQLCTEDADCPPPVGVCVNSTFGSGLCTASQPCQ